MSIIPGMFSLPFLSRNDLSSREKHLLLRACVCVAASDGRISRGEIDAFKRSASEFGGFHAGDIDKAIADNVGLDPSLLRELGAMPPPKAHLLLKLLFLVSNADDSITEQELFTIKSISEAVLPGKPWASVQQWITSYKAFIDASRTLFATD